MTGLYRATQGNAGLYSSHGYTGLHRTIGGFQDYTELYRQYRAIQCHKGLCRGYTGLHRAIQGNYKLYSTQGCTGLYMAIQDYTGLYRT